MLNSILLWSEYADQNRCRELAKSSTFYRRIYSEVEEIGWEHLVSLEDDLRLLSFRVMDKKGRAHIVKITLDGTYPNHPPSISADVPYLFNVKWSINSTLKDVVLQFHQHLDELQDFWNIMDDIDRSPLVSHLKNPQRALSHRRLNIGNDCYIMLSIDSSDPTSLPECRFLGTNSEVERVRMMWRRNCKRWKKDKPFSENLVNVLDIQLAGPTTVEKTDPQTECGICYAQYLPIDDELGDKSGSSTDCTCENSSCSRAFHSICLGDWLRSITTTRQSFDVLFGNCPYCSDPIAVKINSRK